MSHDHHHRHPHGHDADHHAHSHDDAGRELKPAEKLAALLAHWIKHNEGHAQTYREWAGRARDLARQDVAAALEEAAALTLAANDRFEQARKRLAAG